MCNLEWIEHSRSTDVLINLLKLDKKVYFQELMKHVKGSNTTIKDRLDSLKETNLIEDETEEKTDAGSYIGVKRYIWLTPKGKRVAEKLIEIEEIFEENDKIK